MFPFAGQLAAYRAEIDAVIDDYPLSRSLRLHGDLDELRVADLSITDEAIVALVELRGQAELVVASAK